MSRRNRNKGSKPTFTVIDEPYLIEKTLAAGTPLGQAMHTYNAEMARRVFRDTDTTQEKIVPLQSAPPLPGEDPMDPLPTAPPMDPLLMIRSLDERLSRVETALAELRASLPAPSADALNEKIIAFLSSVPGIKFSPTSVAENIGSDNNSRVAERLSTLARLGKVCVLKQEGRRPLYWVSVQ